MPNLTLLMPQHINGRCCPRRSRVLIRIKSGPTFEWKTNIWLKLALLRGQSKPEREHGTRGNTSRRGQQVKGAQRWEMHMSAQSCPTLLQPHGLQPTRLLCPWDSPGKSTGVGCHFLLQGVFLTKRLKLSTLRLLHCGGILYSSATGEALGAECQELYFLSSHLCSRGKRNVSYPTQATLQFTLIVKMGNKMLILWECFISSCGTRIRIKTQY